MKEIIEKKKNGLFLSREELEKAFKGYLDKNIPDYQMSALLMAICLRGMSLQEVLDLTDIFIKSGKILDISSIEGIKVDKHSTGGVGDKTTLIVGPIVASCGVPFIKMCGRGLGYTGGTIDKLESIKGFITKLTSQEMIKQVKNIGIVICSQTDELVPMDKIIYSLRDVTGTVDSIPLIAISIMSKKIALNCDKILLDVKFGSGALVKTKEEAKVLAGLMIEIGKYYNKEVKTLITDMSSPLGYAIGNSLEVIEAMKVLKNEEHNDLEELCLSLAANMVSMGKNESYEEALKDVEEVKNNGKAYDKFLQLVHDQKGDIDSLEISCYTQDVLAPSTGTLIEINALKIGKLAVNLGAGRQTKNDKIDPKVGIVLKHKTGDMVNKGDILCTLYLKNKIKIVDKKVEEAFTIK